MELTDINSEVIVERYIEGCINDFEAGISTKKELFDNIIELFFHLINLDRQRRDNEKPFRQLIKDIEKDIDFKAIDKDGKIFEDNKLSIYKQIVYTANEMLERGLLTDAENYLDRFNIIPDNGILKKYR